MLNKLFKTLLGIVVVLVGLWVVGPYEPAPLKPNLDTSRIGSNLLFWILDGVGSTPRIHGHG